MSLKSLLNKDRKFVSKGWGYEDWIDNNELYCGKDLFIKKGKKLSLHYHNLKTETFFVQSGSVRLVVYLDVTLDSHFKSWEDFDRILSLKSNQFDFRDLEVLTLLPGDSFQVPIGLRHTLFGNLDTHVYEFSTQHFDEDSIRILVGDTL